MRSEILLECAAALNLCFGGFFVLLGLIELSMGDTVILDMVLGRDEQP